MEYIKKGPWTAEEDDVLINHVKKYGPRDWSSIRSKGLLPRTGKSCRLRWVNKLRPNLKTGCKFSAEEERVVVELQGQFGNRWAKIATYLPGRTDNDVKNFWSSRRKRLERILQSGSSSKPHRNMAKTPYCNVQVEDQIPPGTSNQLEQNPSSGKYLSNPNFHMENNGMFKMVKLPEMTNPNYQNLQIEAIPLQMVPQFESSSDYNFTQLSESQLDFPLLLSGCQKFPHESFDLNFFDAFGQQKDPESSFGQKFETMFPTLGLENVQSTSANSFFDDFPTDMFDYIEQLPTSP